MKNSTKCSLQKSDRGGTISSDSIFHVHANGSESAVLSPAALTSPENFINANYAAPSNTY